MSKSNIVTNKLCRSHDLLALPMIARKYAHKTCGSVGSIDVLNRPLNNREFVTYVTRKNSLCCKIKIDYVCKISGEGGAGAASFWPSVYMLLLV